MRDVVSHALKEAMRPACSTVIGACACARVCVRGCESACVRGARHSGCTRVCLGVAPPPERVGGGAHIKNLIGG